MKLKVVTPYGSGAASSRARVFEWLTRIGVSAEILDYAGAASSGAGTLLRSPLALARAERALRQAAARRSDVVLMHRYASPFSRGEIEERLLHSGERSVLDFDDAVQWDWRAGMTGVVKRPPSFLRAAKAADVVVAGNAWLANWATEWCRQVVLIPTCIEPNDYAVKTDFSQEPRPRLGWIGSPSTEGYLRLIEAPLLELHRRTGAMLIVISAGNRSLGPLDQMVKRITWSLGKQAQLGQLMDIGIMPLTDSVWSRGKCGYKMLQYAAAALPAVVSPAGANAEIAAVLGYTLAGSNSRWVEALEEAIQARSVERAARGTRARSAVIRRYSYSAWLPRWSSAVFGDVDRSNVSEAPVSLEPHYVERARSGRR